MLFLSAALSPVEELLLSQGNPVSPSVQCSLQASKDLGCCQQVGLGYITVTLPVSVVMFICHEYNWLFIGHSNLITCNLTSLKAQVSECLALC